MTRTAPDGGARLAVVTCCDSGMLPAACAALLSARRNCRLENVAFYLVGCRLGPEDTRRLSRFLADHELRVTVLSQDEDGFTERELRRFGPAALLRLHLARILPDRFDRVLYLDADLLVVSDLAELLLADLAGQPLAAVEWLKAKDHGELLRRKLALGMDPSAAYFNSGVMLLDWPAEIRHGRLRRAHERILAGREFKAADQDVLNAVYAGLWQPLDHAWNTRGDFAWLIPNPRIVHFAGPGKPWLAQGRYLHARFRRLYRAYLRGHWDDFVQTPGAAESLSLLLRYPGQSLRLHRLGRNIARRYLRHRPLR